MGRPLNVIDLVALTDGRRFAGMPEMDAITDRDALQEADLVDVRLTAVGGWLAVLFDLRTSLQFRLANTAVLVMRGVQRVDLVLGESGEHRSAHYVMTSVPAVRGALFSVELVCLNGWRLSSAATAAEFYVGDVAGLPPTPPNFMEHDERVVQAGMPSFESEFEPGWATFLEPRG